MSVLNIHVLRSDANVNPEPLSTATAWLRVSYWTGAIADGVMAVVMLYPPIGISGAEITVETRRTLPMEASLIREWTVLLLWADREPVERRGLLVLTVLPGDRWSCDHNGIRGLEWLYPDLQSNCGSGVSGVLYWLAVQVESFGLILCEAS
jgi:hypothetical protein